MWIFSKYFFCSAVESHFNKNVLVIRFRTIAHAWAFTREAGLTKNRIYKTKGRDYLYRVFMNKREFSALVFKLSMNIDYSNFKDSVKKRGADQEEQDTLMNVWFDMASYQDNKEGVFISSYYGGYHALEKRKIKENN